MDKQVGPIFDDIFQAQLENAKLQDIIKSKHYFI